VVLLPLLVGLLLIGPGVVSGQAPRQVELDEVTDNLDDYIGQQVTIDAEISDVIEPRAFVIRAGGALGVGGAELLVLSATMPSITVEEGQEVRVTGRVGRFDLEAFELAVGGQLDGTAYADWDDEAVFVLQSIAER
jgi:hypothetical protein